MCVNVETTAKCDGCGVPAEVALLLPAMLGLWVEFPSTDELDKWIANVRTIWGSKVWRKTN